MTREQARVAMVDHLTNLIETEDCGPYLNGADMAYAISSAIGTVYSDEDLDECLLGAMEYFI